MLNPKKRRKWTLNNAAGSPFELWISILTIVNVVSFLLRPEANPIHDLVYPWDFLWAFMYALAGVAIFIGLVRERSAHFEASGLLLLLAGLAVQLAVFGTLGVSTLTGTWGTFVSLSTLSLIAIWRLKIITKASKAIQKMEENQD